MLCDECKKNPATIHFTKVAGGVSNETHLCQSCMEKHKKNFELGDMQGLLSSLLSSMGAEVTPKQERTTLTCSRCGMDFERFRKTGMLGCAQCYQDFRKPLAPILMRIHGRVQHAGHVPPGIGRARQERIEMQRLKLEMDEAVASENFEKAATLRDRIREMQSAAKECGEGETCNAQ